MPAGDNRLREVWPDQPLNCLHERYAREAVGLSLSTMADQVDACTVALKPLQEPIEAQVLAVGRLHGDESPAPVLATERRYH